MTEEQSNKTISYKDAGVDIDAGNELVDKIKTITKCGNKNMTSIGGFAAGYELPAGYQEPVLVSCTDGVGTKLKLAIEANNHHGIGIDLVAMCANDLIVCGAAPLFFLDYYATGKLDVTSATEVIVSIQKGCELADMSLVGGETAEMPGMYSDGDYDLAGFSVGIVEKSKAIDGSLTSAGDVIIGLASSGPHSNGYSLIRRLIDNSGVELTDSFDGRTFADALLEPTVIYVKLIQELISNCVIKSMAHITGGGLLENIPRTLSNDLQAELDSSKWIRPAIFDWIQEQAQLPDSEMYKTFNCGIGMTLCVDESEVAQIIEICGKHGIAAWQIGAIKSKILDESEAVVIK